MEHHNKINKNKQPSLTPKTVQTKGVYLQDNRPSSILQKNNTLNTKLATIQRKISYNAGRYENREALIEALEAIFEEAAHERITYWVNQYEKSKGRAQYASTVYNYIIGYLKGEGFQPTFGKTSSTSDSNHGPLIPSKVNRDADSDSEEALKTFNFSSVTLGKLTLIGNSEKIHFQDRQIDANFHAEDGLLEQLEAYIEKNEIKTNQVRINLTINNFFCARHSTKKKNKSQNCLHEIIELQKKYKFARFHVYFQNTYGSPELMDESIKKLQKAGILVTSFSSTDDPPYFNKLLDPASESEDDEKEESSSSSYKKRGKESKKEIIEEKEESLGRKEQLYLSNLLRVNNCLINAIARPGLGRNANIGELVAIRLQMKQRGFAIGEMLVASPAIIRIILNALGINRGVRVVYQNSRHPDDRVAGPNTIIVNHQNRHFQEREEGEIEPGKEKKSYLEKRERKEFKVSESESGSENVTKKSPKKKPKKKRKKITESESDSGSEPGLASVSENVSKKPPKKKRKKKRNKSKESESEQSESDS
ncbi:hypothetical protein [Flavobacterium hydrophilum]|uniref:Uncharacterized protein n=1 Tax=Flavobacterium hydrophilum TaxID=2211445 RepID=A0A2V4C636_9FLAO|nr:hypothetical protein [Flavobacterium hydrophilum]PXY46808.1 hypothetical protein DMB68_06530 [Flavobacterium hydrophilum]